MKIIFAYVFLFSVLVLGSASTVFAGAEPRQEDHPMIRPAYYDGQHGWISLISEIIGPDATCGPGMILLDIEIRDYRTDSPVSDGLVSTLVTVVNRFSYIMRQNISDSDSMVGPFCFNPDTDVVSIDVNGREEYYNFLGMYAHPLIGMYGPHTLIPRGHHVRAVVWVESIRRSPPAYGMAFPGYGFSATNVTDPSFSVVLNNLHNRFHDGVPNMTVFIERIRPFPQMTYTREVAQVVNQIATISPGLGSMSDGIYSWSAYVDFIDRATTTFMTPYMSMSGIMGMGDDRSLFIIDTTPPVVTGLHTPSNPNNTNSVYLTSDITDNLSGITEVKIFANNTLVTTCSYGAVSSTTCSVTVGPYAPGTTVSYYFTARDWAGNTATSTTNQFTVSGLPDLVPVGVPVLSSGTLEIDQGVTFLAQTRNNGSWSSGNFRTNFSYRFVGGNPSWINVTPFADKTTLNTGAVATEDTAFIPLTNSGTLQVQYCVDSDSTVTESDEGNNCVFESFTVTAPTTILPPEGLGATSMVCGGVVNASWNRVDGASGYEVSVFTHDGNSDDRESLSTVTVAQGSNFYEAVSDFTYTFYELPTNADLIISVRTVVGVGEYSVPVETEIRSSDMCRVLTGVTCMIPAGASTCDTALVNWDMTGGGPPYRVVNTSNGNFEISTDMRGAREDVTLVNGDNTINTYSNGVPISTLTLVANCVPENFFLESAGRCVPEPNISFAFDPWVRSGGTTDIVLSINSPYDLECSLHGGVSLVTSFTHTAGPVAVEHLIETVPIQFSRILRITCDTPNGELQPPLMRQVRINMIPRMHEP